MCGINLIISKSPIDLHPAMERMVQETAFRGPDSKGEFFRDWRKGSLAIGANRLRIIDDDSNADQPMVSDCGNYILAFNGEVYNYQDLKSELIGIGQEFRTHSDTEVVLYWLKHKGKEGLGRLKGMFAISFVDIGKETVLIARDSFGIKPLFFYQDEENVVASSSITAMMSSGIIEKKINRHAVDDYLAFRFVMGRITFYQGVMSVEPGTAVEISKEGSRKFSFTSIGENENLDLKETLIDSVTILTNSQSPALLLSGGVDSTLLLAIYRHELGNYGMPTYTLNNGDDAKWSAIAAKQFDAEHTLVDIEEADVERALGMFDMMDQPVADHGALATWLISEKAKLNHRVLLSGAGADELFGGYNRHRAFDSYLRKKDNWLRLKNFASAVNYIGFPKQLKTLLQAIDGSPTQTFKNFLAIYGVKGNEAHNARSEGINLPGILLDDALNFDLKNYLVNDVLAITDIATMSHGIEARVPYLFDTVVDSAQAIPSNERIGDKGKSPLKKMLREYDGGSFAKRNKMGFGLPMGKWLRNPRSPLWSIIKNSDPVFKFINEEQYNEMAKEHLAGKKDWNMQLWSILVLSHWLNKNFN
jgi:asparagine synthase (glutamine-hydrolysing)